MAYGYKRRRKYRYKKRPYKRRYTRYAKRPTRYATSASYRARRRVGGSKRPRSTGPPSRKIVVRKATPGYIAKTKKHLKALHQRIAQKLADNAQDIVDDMEDLRDNPRNMGNDLKRVKTIIDHGMHAIGAAPPPFPEPLSERLIGM